MPNANDAVYSRLGCSLPVWQDKFGWPANIMKRRHNKVVTVERKADFDSCSAWFVWCEGIVRNVRREHLLPAMVSMMNWFAITNLRTVSPTVVATATNSSLYGISTKLFGWNGKKWESVQTSIRRNFGLYNLAVYEFLNSFTNLVKTPFGFVSNSCSIYHDAKRPTPHKIHLTYLLTNLFRPTKQANQR